MAEATPGLELLRDNQDDVLLRPDTQAREERRPGKSQCRLPVLKTVRLGWTLCVFCRYPTDKQPTIRLRGLLLVCICRKNRTSRSSDPFGQSNDGLASDHLILPDKPYI